VFGQSHIARQTPFLSRIPKKKVSGSSTPTFYQVYKMSALAALRTASRAGAARFVAGMRVSVLASSAARPAMLNTARIAAGSRSFSATLGRFGSGTSEYCVY